MVSVLSGFWPLLVPNTVKTRLLALLDPAQLVQERGLSPYVVTSVHIILLRYGRPYTNAFKYVYAMVLCFQGLHGGREAMAIHLMNWLHADVLKLVSSFVPAH